MARFPDSFLDEIRSRLRVSDVVGRRVKLKKRGAEYVGLSPFQEEKTPSFTVNDAKGFFHDFSSGRHGDIFAFEMATAGGTFTQAVESLAHLAGVPLPDGRAQRANGGDAEARANGGGRPGRANGSGRAVAATAKQIAAAYPYTDADGTVLYEVARLEWTENGQRRKSFLQRRPVDGEPRAWAWGLAAGTYVRGRTGDYYQLTDARADWPGERRELDEVAHGLYRFCDLREEMAQPVDERRIVFIPEGEKDADTAHGWDLVATTNSGGSKNWHPHFAEHLRGADAVVLIDNDKSGRERGHIVASSLRGVAARVRLVDFREHWPACPEGGDLTDWRDHGGGTAEKLFKILDRLPEWSPQPPDSSFGAVRWSDLDRPARELEWLVKRIVTRSEVSIWFGPPGCGKSFLITDMALAVARGISWFGQRVRQGLVVYQAGEGGLGLKRRLRAYRKEHAIADDLPFVLLPTRLNLWKDEADVEKLIAEIRGWAAFYDSPLELVVIDTMSAAAVGANENASEDIGRVLQRCHRIASDTGAHVALVHHTPKGGGSPRGWSGLTGNVESSIEVIRQDEQVEQQDGGKHIRRDVREFVTRKQKDSEDNFSRAFVLRQVVVGVDLADGEAITSCVVAQLEPAAGAAEKKGPALRAPPGYADLNPGGRSPNNLIIFRALTDALKERGRRPAPEAKAPEFTAAVTVRDWQEYAARARRGHDSDERRNQEAARKAIERACARWTEAPRLLAKGDEWIWRTERRVFGIDLPPSAAPKIEARSPYMTDEDEEDGLPF